jgi:hypothetical protein
MVLTLFIDALSTVEVANYELIPMIFGNVISLHFSKDKNKLRVL